MRSTGIYWSKAISLIVLAFLFVGCKEKKAKYAFTVGNVIVLLNEELDIQFTQLFLRNSYGIELSEPSYAFGLDTSIYQILTKHSNHYNMTLAFQGKDNTIKKIGAYMECWDEDYDSLAFSSDVQNTILAPLQNNLSLYNGVFEVREYKSFYSRPYQYYLSISCPSNK